MYNFMCKYTQKMCIYHTQKNSFYIYSNYTTFFYLFVNAEISWIWTYKEYNSVPIDYILVSGTRRLWVLEWSGDSEAVRWQVYFDA